MNLKAIIKKKVFCGCLAVIFAFNSFLPVSAMIRCRCTNFKGIISSVGSYQYIQIKSFLTRTDLTVSPRLLLECICLAISKPMCDEISISDLFEHLCFCHVKKLNCPNACDRIPTVEEIVYPKYDDDSVIKILEIIYKLCVQTSTTIIIYPYLLERTNEDSVWKRVAKDFCYNRKDVFFKAEYLD